MFSSLGDMMSMMGNLSKLTKQYKSMMEELKTVTVDARSGDGMVLATANGLGELMDIKIDPKLLADGDAEALEDLVTSAVIAVTAKARDLMQEKMGPLTGGLPMDQLKGLLGN